MIRVLLEDTQFSREQDNSEEKNEFVDCTDAPQPVEQDTNHEDMALEPPM